jgi:3-hydroxybutyryl-CoA dehydrogenase
MSIAGIATIGVIGAGQMGRGIAQVAATSGYRVILADASPQLATQGKQTIGAQLAKLVDKGKLDKGEGERVVARIESAGAASDFAEVDLAVEAATEDIELKRQILARYDAALPERAILATNTSSISITKLASATKRADRVMGMHFMNPVPLMKLCELVRGVQTSHATFETVKTVAESLGKTVIVANDYPGFIVNRMLIPLLNEACFALQEGVASAEDIDQGAKLGLNHPLGPLELSDLIGLDTVLAIADVLHKEIGDPKYRAPTLLRNLVAAGWLGKKTGRGFFRYEDGVKRG